MSSGTGTIEGEPTQSGEHPSTSGASERDPRCADDPLSRVLALCEELRDRVSSCEREIRELKAANEALASENKRVVEMLGSMKLQKEPLPKENESLTREVAKVIQLCEKPQASPQKVVLPNAGALLEKDFRPAIIRLLSQQPERGNPAKKLFFTRQSSNDLYGLLDPASRDEYASRDAPGAWIEIELRYPVEVNGLIVTSNTGDCHPKHFIVMLIGGTPKPNSRVIEFKNESALKRDGGSVKKAFKKMLVQKIHIKSCGSNSCGSNTFRLGGFELLSPDPEYSSGVFHTLYSAYRDNIYEYVDIRARDWGRSEFFKYSSNITVCTSDWNDHEWFEVEFLCGSVCVGDYHLCKDLRGMREWSLRGSNDRSIPTSEWEVIDRSVQDLDDTECRANSAMVIGHTSPPFRFLRLVNEGLNWDGKSRHLMFRHFDVSGYLIQG